MNQAFGAAPIDAQSPVGRLLGVGPRLVEKLQAAGITRVQDLWFLLPLRYEDRTRLLPIAALRHGAAAQCEGRVTAVERGFRFRPQLNVGLSDDRGASLRLRFFHFRGNQVEQFRIGRRVLVFGEPRAAGFGLEMIHPSYRFLTDDEAIDLQAGLTPVYSTLEGIGPVQLAKLIALALTTLPRTDEFDAALSGLVEGMALPSLADALRTVHRPPPQDDLPALIDRSHPAQRRLAIDELLAHQLSLAQQRSELRSLGAVSVTARSDLPERLVRALPFSLTAAQKRVLQEIRSDLRRPQPMLRLLQGDVGSGKTAVAALSAALVIGAGLQVAVLAPTELLAEQHHRTFERWFAPLGVRLAWLAAKQGARSRREALAAVASGEAKLVVGTHALMQEHVAFHNLVLCIIDEQHRFGVHQRLALRDKGVRGELLPHQLVMTATPIPRTLAMTAYADLDVSVIDALPPGRSPVRTVLVSSTRREEVIERIRAACAGGRQAYWVCTLIDDSEEVQAQAAASTHALLQTQLAGLRVGLVHGRLKPAEKQAVMQAFKSGALELLVATTVIEVGVDVPKASLMVIENPERLGLAQLHQLRGRVGRGATASSCVLLYQSPLSQAARARLEIMRSSQDGFAIAEADLRIRGAGELLGTRQAGLAQFRVADLSRDADLLPIVQQLAAELLVKQPQAAAALVRRWVGAAARYADV